MLLRGFLSILLGLTLAECASADLVNISFSDSSPGPAAGLVSNGRSIWTRSNQSAYQPGQRPIEMVLTYADGSRNEISGFLALNDPTRRSGPGSLVDGSINADFGGGTLKLFDGNKNLLLAYDIGGADFSAQFGSKSALLDASGQSTIIGGLLADQTLGLGSDALGVTLGITTFERLLVGPRGNLGQFHAKDFSGSLNFLRPTGGGPGDGDDGGDDGGDPPPTPNPVVPEPSSLVTSLLAMVFGLPLGWRYRHLFLK